MAQKKKAPVKAQTEKTPKSSAAKVKSTSKAATPSKTDKSTSRKSVSAKVAAQQATPKVAAKKAVPKGKAATADKPKVAASAAASAKPKTPVAAKTARRASAAAPAGGRAKVDATASRAPSTTREKLVKAVAAAVAKPAVKRDVTPEAKPPVAAPQPAAERKVATPKSSEFKTNEFVVYPAHGVGQIVAIEEQEIAGMSLELFVITFEKDKMTLRVPTAKLATVGMRKLAAPEVVEKAMTTLKGRARVKRTMWSRRAQEYEAKINSGDLVSIAEVVRDLYRSETQPDQSYSERQLYEAALDRMARELAAVEGLDERGAVQRITDVLAKSAKGRRMAEDAAAEAEADDDADSKAA